MLIALSFASIMEFSLKIFEKFGIQLKVEVNLLIMTFLWNFKEKNFNYQNLNIFKLFKTKT